MKKVFKFISHLLGFIWNMPLTLASGLLAIIYEPLDIFWKDWAIHITVRRIIPSWAVGQTIGNVIFYQYSFLKKASVDSVKLLVSHEVRHVRQGQVLGIFFLFAYPIASIVALARNKRGYQDNWFELDADRWAEKVNK